MVSAHDDFYKCDTCGKWAWVNKLGSLSLFSVGDQQILDAADASALINFSFNNGHLIPAKQAPTGIGRKDLPGYADDKGAALVDKDGWPTATYTMLLDGYDTSSGVDTVYQHSTSNNGSWYSQITGSYSAEAGNVSSYGIYDSTISGNQFVSASIGYYYVAPVTGYYTLNTTNFVLSGSVRNDKGIYKYGEDNNYYFNVCSFFGKGVFKPSDHYTYLYPKSNLTTWRISPKSNETIYFNKGDFIYLSVSATYVYRLETAYPYKSITIQSTAPTLTVQDLTPNQITNNNNITINNNTWNGNIYVDNSTNLTYIYPQYTTINKNNETVTNISNNPIIYNSETKQYYTYDSVTNNYYYITYEQQPATPTPSPSPSPSPDQSEPTPTPDPGTNPTPKPGDSGDISTPESGKPGSSSDKGQSWWDKLLDKLGSALIDGLLDAVKGILKLLFDLISSILGWIIWLCSKVFDLFPFLPPGIGALLVGGVVVCFILAFIKFIRG